MKKITKKKILIKHRKTTDNIKKKIHSVNVKKSLKVHSIKTTKIIKKKIVNKENKHRKSGKSNTESKIRPKQIKHTVKKAVHVIKKTVPANDTKTNIRMDTTKNPTTPNIKIAPGPKRVIIVHGWDGDINKGWFPWIKKELETQGFKVIMERMPSPGRPVIDEWIDMLKSLSGKIDDRTYFIGHSIGCQTIMRMLENVESEKIGGAVFLAGWFDLKERTYTENPKTEKEMRKIAEPWISTRFDLYKVKSKFNPGTVTAIFSEDDPYVDLKNAEAFKEWLDARIIIENGKGHFEEAKISQMPLLVEEMLRISKESEETK